MKRIFIKIMALTFCLFFLSGASNTFAQQASPKIVKLLASDHVAVMPFMRGIKPKGIDDPINKILNCPLPDLCLIDDDIPKGAEDSLTLNLQNILKKNMGDIVVRLAHVRDTFEAMPKLETDTLKILAMRIGEAVDAQYVIAGIVWRYKERVGAALAAETPASVAFSLYLIKVDNGQGLWKETFDKTQRSLSENLLEAPMFLSKGMKWLSAGELSEFGLQKLAKKLPLK